MAEGDQRIDKRMNYFDRQFLRAQDFKDEQAYWIDRRRRHNRLLHTPGVIEGGLNVSKSPNDSRQVLIDAGMALDADGKEIILFAPQSLPAPGGSTTEARIYILYGEAESNDSKDPGAFGRTRIEETPLVKSLRTKGPEIDSNPPENWVLLAQVQLNNGEVLSVDNTVRKLAATPVAQDAILRTLTLRRDAVDPRDWPRLSCTNSRQTTLQTSSLIVSDGNIGIGTGTPQVKLHVVGDGASDVTHLRAETTGNTLGPQLRLHHRGPGGREWLIASTGTSNAGGAGLFQIFDETAKRARLNIDPAGRVGIETTSPTESLDTNRRIKAGALTIGPWPANENYVFFGSNALDQTGQPGNYALLQGVTSERGATFLNSPERINFRIGNGDKMILTKEGNVGIGTTNPGAKLDVTADVAVVVSAMGGATAVRAIGRQTGVTATGSTVGLMASGPLAASLRGKVEIVGAESHLDVEGNISLGGNLIKKAGQFKIDHPLDPSNKYLSHSFVESPDMMNVYNGNVVTDDGGYATIVLPEYFEALNRDFRYQLTAIGQFAQAIVASEIDNNRFMIKTDKPKVKVSWQVTGVRQDAWANAHRIKVEEDKPEHERGLLSRTEPNGQGKEVATAILSEMLSTTSE